MNVAVADNQAVSVGGNTNSLDALFSEGNLLQLLVAIRGSSMPDEEKIKVRDLVLEYSQLTDEHHKNVVRTQVMTGIAPYQADFAFLLSTEPPTITKPTPSETDPAPAIPNKPLGRTRPQPPFGNGRAASAPPAEESAPASALAPEPPSSPIEPTPSPEAEVAASESEPPVVPAEPVMPPAPEVPSVSEQEPAATSIGPAPVAAESEMPPAAPAEPALVEPTPASTNPAPPTQPEPPAASVPTGPTLKRIQEIKLSVNSRVGNPVSLIDADNTIGREYMDALLDALKGVATGEQSSTLPAAMERLEAAYQAVDSLIEEKGVDAIINPPSPPPLTPEPPTTAATTPASESPTPSTESVNPAPAPVPEPAPVDPTSPEPTPAPIKSAVSPVVKKLQVRSLKMPGQATEASHSVTDASPESAPVSSPTPTPESIPPAAAQPTPTPPPVTPSNEQTEVKAAPEPAKKASPLQSLTARLFSKHTDAKDSQPTDQATPTSPKTKTPEPAPLASDPHTLHAVGAVETLPEKMTTLKKVFDRKAEEERAALGDDINSAPVTAGLEQLLSEWKIFKSSGLLGTGPGGRGHPLDLKLKDMPMAAVISGRFEGATREIKQGISDYMSGWRYEQGITHEMNEQFEHYLRRVILNILKKQSSELPNE